MKKLLTILMAAALLLALAGCAGQTTDNNTPPPTNNAQPADEQTAIADFGVKILQQSAADNENVLVSPLSVYYALGMAANGAADNTLAQMENVLGLPADQLNQYLGDYIKTMPSGDNCKTNLANGIWITPDIEPASEFLQTCEDIYHAEVFRSVNPDEINSWVSKQTEGMIPSIIDEVPNNIAMYLINALAFDAKWDNKYNEYDLEEGTFMSSVINHQDATFMNAEEKLYLENENATGFVKYYKGKDYAFVGLLPKNSLNTYLKSLTGAELTSLLSNAQKVKVETKIPAFTNDYATEISEILQKLGMTDAFNKNAANFQPMGINVDGPVYLSRVLHKTHIEVDAEGTKAAAVTAVEEAADCAEEEPVEEIKYVYLDKPFLYMIIDCKQNLPIFIGTVNSVE